LEEANNALDEIAKEIETAHQVKEDIFSLAPEDDSTNKAKETNKFKEIFDVDEDALLEMLDHTGLRQQRSDSETSSLIDEVGNLTDKEALKFADAINQAFFEKMEEIDT
jgi:DNA-directed RNA polymerase beta' subunit